MKSKVASNRLYLFLTLAILGCALDLWTKSYFFERLGMPLYYLTEDTNLEEKRIVLVDGVLTLETHLNEGALFGIGQGRSLLFAGLSFAAAIGIFLWFFCFGASKDWLLSISLGCVLSGILGNLYDRIGLPGLLWEDCPFHKNGEPVYAVRDWIHFHIDSINFDWPIFNIADMMLVCGAGILLLHAIFVTPPAELAPIPAPENQ